ncbi:peptide-N(4)-(N-acetyl-beta-glucosaminyl)asparagine amidase isoform X2 [Hydra vulgaris]|uniref:peptide-N(4)-(N-acetyl-beta- glucosaminyl)asparagine amidase isoform X2 n=1 Tax=Hydra vulgaris TaxID=6087 RepID=UPI001F5E4104|nr:peptide-N(4)-(N-acetyl-beta-glucosaminyl)asparagine amidase-like isoform X2 [Hydra vulgaris]
MNNILETCLNELKIMTTTDAYKETIHMLYLYIDNIFKNKDCEKYRKIRIGNEKFHQKVWRFEPCRLLLELCGFEQGNEFLTLSVNGDISKVHSILLKEAMELNILEPKVHPPLSDKTLTIRTKGYSNSVAVQSLIATKNIGVQPAMDWIELHPECKINKPMQHEEHINKTSSYSSEVVQPYQDVMSSRYTKSLDEKHKFQEKQRLEMIKRSKLEKEEEIRVKHNLMMNIESEKKEKRIKYEEEKRLRHFDEAKQQNAEQIHTSKSGSTDSIMLRIKLPNTIVLDWETNRFTSLNTLYEYVSTKSKLCVHDFEVVIPYPHKVLENSHEINLEQEGLYPNGIVVVQMIARIGAATDHNKTI